LVQNRRKDDGSVNERTSVFEHFSEIAADYRQLRTLDLEPINYIKDILEGRGPIRGVDIGSGCGRYSLLLLQHLANLHLTCIDMNQDMLDQLTRYLTEKRFSNFKTLNTSVERLQLEEKSLDCIFTFNAIHHFEVPNFLQKTFRALRKNGALFIYTRTRTQNKETIWGRCFPGFSEKEERLYEIDEMEGWIKEMQGFHLETVKTFSYQRRASLDRLLTQVRGKHYSTFSLYTEKEFKNSIEQFSDNIKKISDESGMVEWTDKNILLHIV